MSRFARSYAQAFLETIPEGYDVDGFVADAEGLARAFAADPRLKNFLAAPAVPLDAKRRLLDDLARAARIDGFGARFLGLALANRRILELAPILEAIRAARDRQLGVVAATVVVAADVGDAERKRIEEALARQLQRKVRMTVEVDPKILGGFVAKVGSEVFDASAEHAIERFQALAREGRGDV